MKFIVPCLLLLVSCYAPASDCNLSDEGKLPAEKEQNFQTLLVDAPDPAAVRFNMALDYAQAGNTQKALSVLEDALADTPWFDPSTEQAFTPLYGCPAFQKLVARVQNKYPPVSNARVVHTIAQRDLIPEGLVSDPVDGTFYVSSIFHRKIVKIAPDGRVSDFVADGQDGLLGVLGLKVDPRDRSVWAASELQGQSALFHFDRSGKTLKHFEPQEPGKHEFNDLVVTAKGDVFVTDDQDNAVYKLSGGQDKLVRIDLHHRFYPNGIALAAGEKAIYVAHAFGIVLVDIASGTMTELQKPKGISLAPVDGLYVREGRLIGIQNGFGANRIVELILTPDGKSVSSGRLLEYRSANLDLPTTGTIYKGSLYYIVNSQLDHEDNGKLRDEEHLQPIRIAALKLD